MGYPMYSFRSDSNGSSDAIYEKTSRSRIAYDTIIVSGLIPVFRAVSIRILPYYLIVLLM